MPRIRTMYLPQSSTATTMVILLFGIALGAEARAQDPDRVTVSAAGLEGVGAGLATFSPRSGPPGTIVALRVRDMPILAPLRVGVGALRMGFEEVGWVLSNDDGELTTDVVIPEWSQNDAVHIFIVFDPYFNPIALSDVFHVTDDERNIVRTGRIAKQANGCTVLHGDDSIAYGLTGELADLRNGDPVEVTGRLTTDTTCQHQTTIRVAKHRTPETSIIHRN